jgi:hypothetical protein
VEEDPAARTAAEQAAERPEDRRIHAALELELERLLEADPELASEVARLWEQAKVAGGPAIAAGDRSIAVSGTATGVFITGDDVNQAP